MGMIFLLPEKGIFDYMITLFSFAIDTTPLKPITEYRAFESSSSLLQYFFLTICASIEGLAWTGSVHAVKFVQKMDCQLFELNGASKTDMFLIYFRAFFSLDGFV